ncbi:MAG TPA: alcohol dehydrogenase catalytic domain-containing protein [Isosphaeraceae bacterium]|nr:alcohol dehydrogenase catalytic domain-containing protein [Isosphaeraceae bacterium]
MRLCRDLPYPEPAPGEEVLRVVAVGICDTDLQLARGYMGFRGVLGHEFVGYTASGKRVTAEINNACRACPTCLAGRPGHCPSRTVLGILNHDGAMAEQVCVPSGNLHFVPAPISDREAVFIEPLAAAFRFTEQVQISDDTQVAVLGDGKLGLLCTWVARLGRAPVTLIGKHFEKLALAGKQVTTVHLAEASQLKASFDIVVDCTGSSTGLPTALELVKPCGTIVLKTTVAGRHDLSLAPIVIDEVRIVGSRCGPFPRAIEALRTREVDVSPLIEAEFPLERAEEAFAAAAQPGARKVIIRVDSTA